MRIVPLLVLALAGCAIDEDGLDTSEVELEVGNVWRWTGQVEVPGQMSRYQPGLTAFGGRLHMVHSGNSSPQELWWSRFNGSSWSTNVKLPHTSSGGPALVVYNNLVSMLYRPYQQNRLMMATSNGTATFGTGVTISAGFGTESLKGEPAAAVFDGQLYLAYCTTSAAHVDRFDGATWTKVMRESISSCEHVEIAAVPTGGLRLLVGMKLTYSNPILEARSATGASWTAWYGTGMHTRLPMSIVTCNGTTHLVHGGETYPNQLWWAELDPAGNWTADFVVPNQESSGGPALGCLNGTRALMVHNGLNNQLWQSEYGP